MGYPTYPLLWEPGNSIDHFSKCNSSTMGMRAIGCGSSFITLMLILFNGRHIACLGREFVGSPSFFLVVEPPIWKICSWNWIISPNRCRKKKYLKPPHSKSTSSVWDIGISIYYLHCTWNASWYHDVFTTWICPKRASQQNHCDMNHDTV